MRWDGDLAAFERWCVEARDLRQFQDAVASLPEAVRPGVVARLREALRQPGPGEPEAEQLSRDTPLVGRMRSPLGVFLRQLRLEKVRLLEGG